MKLEVKTKHETKEKNRNMKRLKVNPNTCIGCRTCELSCAFAHSREGKRTKSRVHIISYGHGEKGPHVPILCLQCDDALCAKVCNVNALVRNEQTGAIDYIEEKCMHCRMCEVACPFGNISFDPNIGFMVKCDLCQGEPACAQFCPTQALTYE